MQKRLWIDNQKAARSGLDDKQHGAVILFKLLGFFAASEETADDWGHS